jgi:hypothetical protein
MDDPNLEMLAAAAQVLRPLLGELVFLGGCTTGLVISDPAAAGVRPTKDITGSHDLEDIVAVIDGREEIAREVAASPADVRTYVASELRHLLGVQAFVDALSGFLRPDSASQSRRPALLRRLRALAESGPSESGN